ncbi:Retrotransposable element Tf2 protein [Rhizoctonia solani]|uniref:Retrotransposable element Tf2 protein n=1 Tax=Rhizoctonia solani TaxID=456999 RepID=A0A8H8SXR1_9AGAM|nr:Retrotransposable element Tf2 protein [Rhizoctonia solani]QRW22406.1 Retrotransposable element Tf2 protein [Rhizoctonia solani]
MTWLTLEAPLIDWQQGLVTFPEQAQIASKEEADINPLADLPGQYHEFAKVFGEEEFKVLPPHREYNIAIDLLLDAKLSPGPIYGMTDAESKALKQHIDEELATGKIRPSTSLAGAPVMFVKKADGSLRLVVDYRKLNDVTHKNVYPLPRQDNLMAKLRHAKVFTKLDLRWGTKYGLFKYLVMPFGLTNAPAAFQHFMNDLFRDLIDVTVVIYLDDILIFSERPEDHPTHVREVLSQLLKNQLFCKLSKCHFHVTTMDYLGIVISPAGFSMDQKKIEAVTSWPTPRTVNLVARSLHNLTKKETPWSWGNQEEEAFQELKSLVTKSPVLIHSNPKLPYYLETDASGVAMGAILSQQGPDNRLHPIAYMSKLFSGAEANYDTHNKELLAIIKALEEWRIFLEATDKPVQVFTDHRNLEYWMQARTFNQQHARWRVFLSDFNFEIHYCPGKQSGKPDALSRRSDYTDTPQEPEVMLPAEVFANTSEEELEIVTEVRNKLREDPSLEPIIQFLTEDADNAPPSIQKAYQDYDWEEDLLWYQGKLVVPDSEPLKEQLLKEFHDSPLAGHPGQQRTLELISRSYWWPGMKSSAKEWVECCPVCQANRRAHAPTIALKPLEVPLFPFHTISYDFITGFPKSNGHNAILVVIDSFSKFGHFIPNTKKVTAKGLADLFISHVWKLHGLPVKTISDRGTTFTGKFLRALYQQLGVKPAFSLAYHPESDGQTERVNQFIEFYLRSYVAADHLDWATWLPLAEYAYNNAKHSATGRTPFELVYGRNPVMNPSNVPANVPEADQVANTLAREWQEAESALRMTKERMTGTKGVVPKYSVGKKVWLDRKNVELRTNSNKLDPKRLGPFEVTKKISSHAYRLKLPETLKIHDVFYVGLLSKAHKSPSQPFLEQPPPETIEGEEEYEVEQIIDSKRQRGKWFYLIKWKGYGPEDNSWEPEELLEHSQEEIERFNKLQLKKAFDSFTKYGIFVKCSKKLKAPKLAELFLEHVWKRHGMPEKTISDRGRVFNNKFLKALYKRLGIDPHFSLAYHPQSNSQTEWVNPSIEHFLRAYSGVNQRDLS